MTDKLPEWVMVPREPTPEMLLAATKYQYGPSGPNYDHAGRWNAMLAAAPPREVESLEAKLREARGLLRIAACPNEDCVDGGYYGTNGEPCQCQWCAERDAILGANDA